MASFFLGLIVVYVYMSALYMRFRRSVRDIDIQASASV